MRLTKDVRQKVLCENEGFKISESFDGKNYKQVDLYQVRKGKIHVTSKGKAIWSKKQIVKRHIANDKEEKKFIKKYLLNEGRENV